MQIEELIQQVRATIEACCHIKDLTHIYQDNNQNQPSQDSIQLSQNISLCLYGSHTYTLWSKSINDIPNEYRTKLFLNHSTPNVFQVDLDSTNEITNEDFDPNFDDDDYEEYKTVTLLTSKQNSKKKRSRQRFSQCDKCLKSWNDIRSFEMHQKGNLYKLRNVIFLLE